MSRNGVNLHDLARGLKEDWCASFDVLPLDDRTWTIATPFILPDGDGFAVLLRKAPGGWLLTDAGITASRAFADLQVTAAKEVRFTQAAEMLGLEVDEWVLNLRLPDFPDASDVSFFLRATTTVYMAPEMVLQTQETSDDRYITRLREAVVERLAPGVVSSNNWHPPQDEEMLYRTDLLIQTPYRPVLMFGVGTSERAGVTALSAVKYRQWKVDGIPFAAVRPSIASKAIARLQDTLGEDRVALIDPKDRFKITRAFRDLGVPMVAA
jgi:hypothetical protein